MKIEVNFVIDQPQPISIGGLPLSEEAVRGVGNAGETVFSYADVVDKLLQRQHIKQEGLEDVPPIEQE